MTVLNGTARRVTAMSFIVLLASSIGFSQVKTTVPDVVPGAPPDTVEHITIHGNALEGNLEGDAVDRTVLVFLPPSYARERNRRYRLCTRFTAIRSVPSNGRRRSTCRRRLKARLLLVRKR